MTIDKDTLGKRAVQALEKNKFAAAYFPERENAIRHIIGLVPEGSIVGIGGSATEKALDIGGKLAEKGCTIDDHNKPGLTKEEKVAIRYRQLASDVFICSSNAVTLTGELVNKDGTGNRVAAMFFGPKKVIVIVGTNKLVEDLDEAENRIRTKAAPLNNQRLALPNPCTTTGECGDCNTKTRICNIKTIISRCPPLTEIHVVIIGEDLGY